MASTTASPTPFTRRSSSSEPNGPSESRSARIRCASVGPILGSARISHSWARSRSTGPADETPRSLGCSADCGSILVPFFLFFVAELSTCPASDPSDVEMPVLTGRFDRCRLPPPLRSTESAESTATICRCRSALAAALGGGGSALSAFVARTPAPSVSTAERNTRARFSDGVGMREDRAPRGALVHRSSAPRCRSRGWRALRLGCTVTCPSAPCLATVRSQS
jgi:hypothetical protein